MSNQEDGADREHLEGIECGAGCTEIWEHLSQRRNDDAVADD